MSASRGRGATWATGRATSGRESSGASGRTQPTRWALWERWSAGARRAPPWSPTVPTRLRSTIVGQAARIRWAVRPAGADDARWSRSESCGVFVGRDPASCAMDHRQPVGGASAAEPRRRSRSPSRSSKSPSGNSGSWVADFDEGEIEDQARLLCLRQVCRRRAACARTSA